MRGRLAGLLLVVVAGALTGYVFTRLEGGQPRIETAPGPVWIGQEAVIDVLVDDDGAGVRSVRTWLELEDGARVDLDEKLYPGSLVSGADLDVERDLEIAVKPAELGLEDGAAVLHVEAEDFSWRGNRATVEIGIQIDRTRPRVSVATGLTYVRRGGAEVAVYGIDERVERHGVRVGDSFFPGYPHPDRAGSFVAFYAVVPDLSADVRPVVLAVDRAGNEASVPLSISIIERRFPSDRVVVSDDFLSRKIPELLPDHRGDLLDGYLKVNREMRAKDAEQILEICGRSSAERLWSGPFLQLPGSKVNASFGEARTYVYGGKVVDRQSHLGFDLASTSRADAPAANNGVVVFAGPLGIYGNTVVVDHGLGLFSLYGHLSEIAVRKGEPIARGDPVGRTGATGLAGGDHLHFAMIVGGTFVDPLEWFDPKWIREHVEAELGGGEAASSPS